MLSTLCNVIPNNCGSSTYKDSQKTVFKDFCIYYRTIHCLGRKLLKKPEKECIDFSMMRLLLYLQEAHFKKTISGTCKYY